MPELVISQEANISLIGLNDDVTGQISISSDTIIFITDRVEDHVAFTQTSSFSLSGDVLESPYGSLENETNCFVLFSGVTGLTGAINNTQRGLTSFSGTAGLTGTFALESETGISFISVSGIIGEFTSTQDSEFEFKSTLSVGNLAQEIETAIAFSGYEEVSGSFSVNAITEAILNGIVTGLSTAIGDLTSTVPTICMNTQTIGVSQYTRYNFNSFFRLGQDYYGCSSAGLYKLGGDLDADTQINDSVVRSGASGFGEQQLKSVRDCYVYIRSSDDTSIRLIANEQVDRNGYPIYYNGTDGLHRRRVKVAQGIRGTTWQTEFKNESGADFVLKQIDVIPVTLERSI